MSEFGMRSTAYVAIELIGGGRMRSASTPHLPFGDRMHQFDADQQDPRTAKGLELQYGPCASLDFPMVLLDHVVEIFGLADIDVHFTIGIDCFERSEIGAAFVDGYRFGHAVPGDRLLEVTPGRTLVTMGA